MDFKEVRDRLRQHMDELFLDAPHTRAAFELQEELLTNCMERYEDLTREGMDEEAALKNVMSSIGDVSELIRALPSEDGAALQPAEDEERRQRSAMTTAIAIGMYILAGAVFFIGALISDYYDPASMIGLVVALLICIAPTCMLVYNAYRWPKYRPKDDSVVEDFKAWSNDSRKSKSLRGAISSVLWTLTVVIYLAVSFITFAWNITWIIFLVAACLEAVINLYFRMREL